MITKNPDLFLLQRRQQFAGLLRQEGWTIKKLEAQLFELGIGRPHVNAREWFLGRAFPSRPYRLRLESVLGEKFQQILSEPYRQHEDFDPQEIASRTESVRDQSLRQYQRTGRNPVERFKPHPPIAGDGIAAKVRLLWQKLVASRMAGQHGLNSLLAEQIREIVTKFPGGVVAGDRLFRDCRGELDVTFYYPNRTEKPNVPSVRLQD